MNKINGVNVSRRPVFDKTVGRSNTGYMGTMLAIQIVQMGYIIISVNIVITIWYFGIDICSASVEIKIACHKVYGFSGLRNGIIESTGVKGLMVHINTGIYHGDTASRAGVAESAVPRENRADHVG